MPVNMKLLLRNVPAGQTNAAAGFSAKQETAETGARTALSARIGVDAKHGRKSSSRREEADSSLAEKIRSALGRLLQPLESALPAPCTHPEPDPERIPTGFRNKAQGCEARATLGILQRRRSTPTGLVSVSRATGAGFVAQIFKLPYRRLAVGRAWDQSRMSAFPNGWLSATLRYSAARRSRNQRSAGLRPAGVLPTQRFDKSSASVALNVLRLTEPRSAKSSRPATIWTDTDRVQLCATEVTEDRLSRSVQRRFAPIP